MRYDYHSKSGPPIVPVDSAAEREQLIAANQAFAAALKQALQSGAETSGGVLATVNPRSRAFAADPPSVKHTCVTITV